MEFAEYEESVRASERKRKREEYLVGMVEAKGEVGARFTYHLLAPCNLVEHLFTVLYKRRRQHS